MAKTDNLVPQVLEDSLDHKDHRVRQDPLDNEENQDLKVHKDHEENQDNLEPQVIFKL